MDTRKPARIFVAGPAAEDGAWDAIATQGLGLLTRWKTAESLLTAVLHGAAAPDLVFIADALPDLDALEVCRRLRQVPVSGSIPLVMMSGQPDEAFVRSALEAGASDVLQLPLNPDLLSARVLCHLSLHDRVQANLLAAQIRREELEHTIEHMRSQIEDRDRTLSRAALVFSHDLATGLPNRRYLVEQLDRTLRRAENDRLPMALIAVEIENFDELRSGLPKEELDRWMAAAAACIQQALRPLDLVARIGGARFAALLIPRELNTSEAVALNAGEAAARTRRALREDLMLDGGKRPLDKLRTAVSVYPSDGRRASELVRHLETALTVADAPVDLQHRLRGREGASPLALGQRLRRAMEDQLLVPYYQPKVDARTGVLIGAETLIRWPTNTGSFMGPAEFIPAAEASGLVPALDDYVLTAVCGQIAEWQKRFSAFRIAVNLSAIRLHHRGVLERLRELFERTGARPGHLEIEITESALITDFEAASSWLGVARELGVKISLDDFGTGYSSLAYLKRLPLDAIKIDQSFVVGIEHEGSTAAIVRAMIAMARALGLTIVAEGVENAAQAAILTQLGCAVLQGFLYSPAVPAQDFERMLERGRLEPRAPATAIRQPRSIQD